MNTKHRVIGILGMVVLGSLAFSRPAKARVISKKEGAREAGLPLIGVQVLP